MFVAFHASYAVIMPALYVPVIVMLLALVIRGVVEFRSSQEGFGMAFAGGSTPRFLSGCHDLIGDIRVENGAAGSPFDWATPCNCLRIRGRRWPLLGATWLV